MTEQDLLEALRVCFDPELSVNIVDLGLVHRLAVERDLEAPGIEPRFHVSVQMLTRTSDEDRNQMLRAQVSNRLAGLPAVSGSTVVFTEGEVWSADRISDAARRQLGLLPQQTRSRPELIQIELPKGPLGRG